VSWGRQLFQAGDAFLPTVGSPYDMILAGDGTVLTGFMGRNASGQEPLSLVVKSLSADGRDVSDNSFRVLATAHGENAAVLFRGMTLFQNNIYAYGYFQGSVLAGTTRERRLVSSSEENPFFVRFVLVDRISTFRSIKSIGGPKKHFAYMSMRETVSGPQFAFIGHIRDEQVEMAFDYRRGQGESEILTNPSYRAWFLATYTGAIVMIIPMPCSTFIIVLSFEPRLVDPCAFDPCGHNTQCYPHKPLVGFAENVPETRFVCDPEPNVLLRLSAYNGKNTELDIEVPGPQSPPWLTFPRFWTNAAQTEILYTVTHPPEVADDWSTDLILYLPWNNHSFHTIYSDIIPATGFGNLTFESFEPAVPDFEWIDRFEFQLGRIFYDPSTPTIVMALGAPIEVETIRPRLASPLVNPVSSIQDPASVVYSRSVAEADVEPILAVYSSSNESFWLDCRGCFIDDISRVRRCDFAEAGTGYILAYKGVQKVNFTATPVDGAAVLVEMKGANSAALLSDDSIFFRVRVDSSPPVFNASGIGFVQAGSIAESEITDPVYGLMVYSQQANKVAVSWRDIGDAHDFSDVRLCASC